MKYKITFLVFVILVAGIAATGKPENDPGQPGLHTPRPTLMGTAYVEQPTQQPAPTMEPYPLPAPYPAPDENNKPWRLFGLTAKQWGELLPVERQELRGEK